MSKTIHRVDCWGCSDFNIKITFGEECEARKHIFCEKSLAEHDDEVRADAIDDFANWLVQQGILGNRCILDGEITDYGKVYAKKYKEQLKEQKNDI